MPGTNAQAFQSPLVGKSDARSGRVLDTITNNAPRPGFDMLSQPLPGGIQLNSNERMSKGVRGTDHPWRFRKATGKKFTLTSGHVNSIVPTGMATEFESTTDGLFVWIKATLDAEGAPTAVELESGETPPTPDVSWFNAESPPSVTYYPLIKVTASGSTIATVEQMENVPLWISRNVTATGCVLSEYQVKWERI